MIVGCNRNSQVEVFRQHLGKRRPALKLARLLADDLAVDRLARLRLRRRGGNLRDRRRAAGVGLGDIGPRAFADFEARPRGACLLGQELQVAFSQHRDLTVADDVHIGARGVKKRVLLLIAQAFDRRPHLRFRGADVVPGLEPVEQQLVYLDPERSGGEAGRRVDV